MKKKITFFSLSLLLLFLAGNLCAQNVARSANHDGKQRTERRAVSQRTMKAVVPSASGNDVTLYGCVVSSYAHANYPAICSFDASPAYKFTRVKSDIESNGGGTYARGKYYGINFKDGGNNPKNMVLTVYDVENGWTQVGSTMSLTHMASDMTYDPVTNQIFGAFTNDFSAWMLGTLNPETGKITELASLPFRLSALAAAKDGELYGIGFTDWKLYHVNKATAECTEIGQIPSDFTLRSWQSATFDWSSGKLYWYAHEMNYAAGLYEISIEGRGKTAKMTSSVFVKDCEAGSDVITGLFLIQDVVTAAAPESAFNLAANFEEGSLYGEVKFTMPAKDTEGKPLNGDLEYTVQIGDMTPITGVGEVGLQVTEEVEVPAAGSYLITVTVSANGVAGVPTTLTVWIGPDIPHAVSNLTLSASGKTMTLSWVAPAEGLHGGYIGGMTYNVVRQPDNVQVAAGLAETVFIETIESDLKAEYWYDVTAQCGTLAGETASSNKVTVGNVISVPYKENFDNAAGFAGYTVIDSNKDGAQWAYNPLNNTNAQLRGNVYYVGSDYNKANDWLITPGTFLKAGNIYMFGFVAQTNRPETFRVALGDAATVEGMTQELLPETTVDGYYLSKSFEYSLPVKVEKDGVYYFGIQALTEAAGTTLFIDNLSIDMIPSDAPAKVEDFTVIPGEKGALNATLSFVTPTKCINGKPLEQISEIRIYRNKELIKTYTTVLPGEALTFEDNSMYNGVQKYTVVAVNEVAVGEEATIAKYVGIDAPGAIRNLKIVEDFNEPGKVIVSWDAPSEVGQNGGYVDVASLNYYELEPINGDINRGTATSFTINLDISKGQTYTGYTLYAVGAGGSGKALRQTASEAIGPALDLPMVESFPGVTLNSGPWLPIKLLGGIYDSGWEVSSVDHTEAGTQDNDGGAMLFYGKIGTATLIRTPKVDISKAQSPAAVFYVYMTGKSDSLQVCVSKEYGKYERLSVIKLNEKPKGWHRYEVSLQDFKQSRFVQMGFAGYVVENEFATISLDNVSIRDVVSKDLEFVSISAPLEINAGSAGDITVQVRNLGVETVAADEYTVELYRNDKLVQTASGKEVAADMGTATIVIADTPTIADPENTVYYAKINFAGDKNDGNNQSTNCAVRIVLPVYPAVKDLAGTSTAEGVSLSWSEPNVADMPANAVTDNVESYANFIISNIGDWRTVDGDGANNVRFSIDGVTYLEYEHAGEPMAFQVFNPELAGVILSSWIPYSGNKMFVAMACSSTKGSAAPQNDDWLISPELNGKKQTVSFFAKGGQSSVAETFEVRYSTTTADVENFTAEQSVTFTTAGVSQWKEYRVELPEGAKYFAIHYISQGKVALLVDNITYTPMGADIEDIMLMGYNIYRDGQKINSEILGETEYIDADVTNGTTYTYKVTAVYDKGESVYSNACVVEYIVTGIEEAAMSGVKVMAGQRSIVVKGAENMPVQVYNVAGEQLFSALGNTNTVIPVEPGVYVVTVKGTSVKVLVK